MTLISFLTITHVAKVLNVHRATVWRMYKRNELNGFVIQDSINILIVDDEKLAAAKKKAANGGFKPKRKKA